MDHGASGESASGSWHPALRPNDDQQPEPSLPTPFSRDLHEADRSDGRLEADSDSMGETVQNMRPEIDNRPDESDAPAQYQVEARRALEGDFQTYPEHVSKEASPPGESSAQDENPEMSSDEDEERLDPAWGISRSGTQQVLGRIERSSSFPTPSMASASTPVDSVAHLPESQAESIMIDAEVDMGSDRAIRRPTVPPEQAFPELRVSNGAILGSEEDSFFEEMASRNQTLEPPTNDQARFEEGLPLVDSQSRPNDEMQQQESGVRDARSDAWIVPDAENEAAFYDHAPALNSIDTSNQLPTSLDRKSTSDVFDSLNLSSDPTVESPTQTFEQMSSQPSAQQHEPGLAIVNCNGKGASEISALWEAVLDDDDFLTEDPDGQLSASDSDSGPGSQSSFLGSLNDGTNFQEPDELLSRFDSPSSHGASVTTNNDAGRQVANQQTSNPYAPHQPSSSDLAQMSPTTYGNVGLFRPTLAPMNFGQNSFQGQFQRPGAPSKAESFVDQSKGGYKSPYDLPMDLSKPRKRVQMHQPPPTSNSPTAPPPRSSSMTSDQPPASSSGPLQSPFFPTKVPFEQQARPPSSQYSAPPSSISRRFSNERPNALNAKASSSSFFEELPITAKPRPPTAQGRYTPSHTGVLPPQPSATSPVAHQLQPSTQMPPPPVPSGQSPADPYAQYQLQRPERLDPYANAPLHPITVPVVQNTRYSPAPPISQTAPPPSRYSPAPPGSQMAPPLSTPSRYSPAPPQSNVAQTQNRYNSQFQPSPQLPPHNSVPQARHPSQIGPPITNALPFQPRTSSPLAYHGKKSEPLLDDPHRNDIRTPTSPPRRIPPPQQAPHRMDSPPSSEPPASGQGFPPPRRSQTQSPGKRGPVSSLIATSVDTMQRPASVHGPPSPVTSAKAFQSFPPARPSVRQRGLSQHLNFIPPTDETQHDELQRWRGSSIFKFGLGGSVLTSFPKHIPRYAAGSAAPMIKPMAGEVRTRNARELFSVPEYIAKFPGPLRSKSKKKEVLAWLSDRIAALENMQIPTFPQQLPDPIKRHDERLLLWKVVRVIVEHDGVVDGNVEVQKAINMVLLPESIGLMELSPMHRTTDSGASGIYKPAGSINTADIVDPAAVESLRKGLLRGEREQAVWTAVDNRLWAHAMLLSSTLDKSIWKQVAHEFVRQEVKHIGVNTESLAALYEIFAGNLEESVDELVPPSARAGLQMVSKVAGAGPTKSALDGLDRWRETLGLVLNNRSPDDQKALAALGRLLTNYGRVEAAHICHLFAISPMLPGGFGGADDSLASIVLLGADHRNQPNEFFLDDDAVLLTEVYEFASSVLATNSKTAMMPHFQVYKLQRAKSLAEAGFKTEAQGYCEAMGVSLRSTTKLSTYYHPLFLAELDELTQRLSQAPTETSSWISKPSMGKVSDSVWNKFTTFVAGGDESDAASNGSGRDGAQEVGPFAKVSGTPTMSRSGSPSDLYGSYAAAAPQTVPSTVASTRYAPSGQYSARSSSDLTKGRPSLDSQRSLPYMSQGSNQRSPYDPNASVNQQSFMSPSLLAQAASPYAPVGASATIQPHQATPPQTSYMSMMQSEDQASPYKPRLAESYVPTPPPEQPDAYMPTLSAAPAAAMQLGSEPIQTEAPTSYQSANTEATLPQHTSNYAPPLQSYSSYEPPSTEYVPYQPDPSSDSDSESRKPKKSFLTTDDDFPSSTFTQQDPTSTGPSDAAAAAARKKANDDAAEAAFRAAAAADAAKDAASTTNADKSLKAKPSWFGSLFSRKEADSLDSTNPPNKRSGSSGSNDGGGGGQKVIRAKLGEESSFYYDKDLKKWVNKKDPPGMQQSVRATPPPPKGPVGRVVSESLGVGGGGGPPLGAGGPPRSGVMAPPPSLTSNSRPGSANGPPSGNGATLEDGASMGPAAAGLAPPPPPPPTSRPTSAVSDIDDLLGGPPTAGARKAGGTIKGKRGRGGGRYVDVMAK